MLEQFTASQSEVIRANRVGLQPVRLPPRTEPRRHQRAGLPKVVLLHAARWVQQLVQLATPLGRGRVDCVPSSLCRLSLRSSLLVRRASFGPDCPRLKHGLSSDTQKTPFLAALLADGGSTHGQSCEAVEPVDPPGLAERGEHRPALAVDGVSLQLQQGFSTWGCSCEP